MSRHSQEAASELRRNAAESIQEYLTPGASLCWHCRKAYGGKGCPWADCLRPNPHWKEALRGGRINGVLVRKCGDFDLEDDKPLDISTVKKIMANSGLLGAYGRPLLPGTILGYDPEQTERLLKKYNLLRKVGGLPPIEIREEDPEDADEEEMEDEE